MFELLTPIQVFFVGILSAATILYTLYYAWEVIKSTVGTTKINLDLFDSDDDFDESWMDRDKYRECK